MLNNKNTLSLKGQTIGTTRASSSYLFIKPHHHTSLQPPPTITLLHPPPSPPQGSTVPGDPNKTLVAAHPPPPMASPEKRCLYEVLNLPRDCTADEIRSAYSKLALQRHPDKLIKSGIPESEATASFQELVNAYKVLSNARERAWYDSHRSQILFSGTTSSSSLAVNAFYGYWLGFVTVMDFVWADEYDVMSGPNRRDRERARARIGKEERRRQRR
ncbi:putative DnaJ domain, Chaperone J-domain superfamily [Helianthus annuus]|nr:putative DnaJ domain, Chaperone J-domain superfamily [Helianthus annuus]